MPASFMFSVVCSLFHCFLSCVLLAAYGTVGAPDSTPSTGGGATIALGHVRALYDYTAQGEEEISFRDGDVIVVLEKEDDNWWLGALRGRQGMFPCSYVEELRP